MLRLGGKRDERKVELRKGVEEVGVYEKGGFWYSGIPLMGVRKRRSCCC